MTIVFDGERKGRGRIVRGRGEILWETVRHPKKMGEKRRNSWREKKSRRLASCLASRRVRPGLSLRTATSLSNL